MHHSPVAILQNKRHGREYRASSLSHQQQLQLGQGLGQLGTSAGTPSSLSSSYIDHAFDHPTPTSFSQLQFLSSSVASNEGSDYTHRVPKVEEKFCSGFHCCGLELDDLHHLLEHFEECHVLSGPPDPNNLPAPMTGVNSAFESHSSSQDGPQFDDFDEEEAERQRRENPNGTSSQSQQQSQLVGSSTNNASGTGPTLSAPPSPALSSYSDNFPSGHNNNANNGSTSAAHPLYELKTKRRSVLNNSSQSSFPSFRSGKSRSPPSGGDDESAIAAGGVSEDENSGHLPFTRRARQQSVDSVASVSTNASTSSKKRSFGAAMGSSRPNLAGSSSGTANNSQVNLAGLAGVNPSALSSTRGRPGIGGIDLTNIRGPMRSAISTPDSSVPGTPASDYMGASTSEMIDSGCLPPSLLFPHAPTRQFDDNDSMATDDDDDDDGNGDAASNASFYTGYEFDESQDEDAQGETEDMDDLQSSFGGHEHKRSRTSSSSASASQRMRNPRRNGSGHVRYDSQTDQQAAAMFSPLSLLTSQNTVQSVYQQQYGGNNNNNNSNNGGSNIPVPTVANSTSPNSQATASAATLAAIQAAAAANGINTGSTPTGRIWIPNNAKPFKCPVPGCDKAYKQQNGLKYHRLHGHCNSNGNGKEGEGEVVLNEEDKPFGCYVGPACGKKYKNMNGLRYHYQHSGAHGQIGLQMLSNGTHPPPAYPPGHKRSSTSKANVYSEYSNTASPTVVMNQSTAEALLAAISTTNPPHHQTVTSSGHSSRNNSRPATPRLGTPNTSRGPSPTRQRTSPQRQASMSSFPSLPMGMGVAMDDY